MADESDAQKSLIYRLLFLVFLVSLTLLNMIGSFRGISTARGMEYAQMSREVARGNVMGSKVIAPLDYAIAEEANGGEVELQQYKNPNFAPLYILTQGAILKLVGGDQFEKWQMNPNENIYALDRVVGGFGVICFLLSIGVTYFLVSRIFDTKIAGVTALLMLLCNLFWRFTESGLPQMMMLLLFSLALMFSYTAVVQQSEEKSPLVPAVLGGLCLGLLTLTHWMGVWILLGYVIYCAVAFRPRGVSALVVSVIGIALSALSLFQLIDWTGTVFGNTRFLVFSGYGDRFADLVMRTYQLTDLPVTADGLVLRIATNSLLQLSEIFTLLGSVFAAPLFFLSLLHVFKKLSISNFRWLVLLMWVMGAVGMALFGLGEGGAGVNQLHMLFIPIMTAYGLAFLSILWAKLEFVTRNPGFRNAHFVIIILLSAGPLILSLPDQVKGATAYGLNGQKPPQPYFPSELNRRLHQVPEDQIIVSDQPWATAWYTDRVSLWLPRTLEDFAQLEQKAELQKTPFAGVLASPYTSGQKQLDQVMAENGEFNALLMDSAVLRMTYPQPVSPFQISPLMKPIRAKYRVRSNLVQGRLTFYGVESLNVTDR